jgi:hypothetical protein
LFRLRNVRRERENQPRRVRLGVMDAVAVDPMMQVNDRGVFKILDGKSVYGRVLEVKENEAIIEHFDGNLNRFLYHINEIDYVNETKQSLKKVA